MLDAILRKICIINHENFFDHYNIWTNISLNPEFHIAEWKHLPMRAISKFGVFKVWKIWKTLKIGNFQRNFPKNLHIKCSNFFHHWNRGTFFYPNLKFHVPPLNGLVFTAQIRLLHFMYLNLIFLKNAKNRQFSTRFYGKSACKIAKFFFTIEIGAHFSTRIRSLTYLLWTV